MTDIDYKAPLVNDFRHVFELPNGHFVLIDLRTDANGEWRVEHLDATGEYIAGLQIPAPEEE